MKRVLSPVLMTGLVFTTSAHADSFRNFSEATGDSADASARVVAAGGQVAIGAVAIPLAASASLVEGTGHAANVIADDLWTAANAPLKVSDDVVIAQPPPSLSGATTGREAQ